MGVQHYISKAHFSNLIMYHWHVLLLLYIQISGYHAITPSPGTTIGTPLTAYSNTTRLCVVSVVQSCPCNATGMYCASVNPPLREVPTVEVKTIVHLDLTGNALERIERGSFLGLEFLISLYLGHNLIDFIDPHAFNNLYKLEILNLEDNQLVNLDPSGRTFQHLTSLKFLYLQKNLITKVNKYTFLTMAAYSPTPATVNLENNPIECDCNVWALKQWRQDNNASGKMNRVTISLMCNNLSYLEVPESIFGSCNASNDGIFSGETRCPICVNESTNDRCHNPATSVCITDLNPNIVCHKTVAWNASTQSIALSSKCLSYDNCMQEEANNADTCSLVNLANTSVACAFCCRGPTCAKNSIGGRTRDFTFYLSFYFNAANSETINLINNTISSRQIESAFLGIPGGIAVNLYAINPKSNQTYRIVLQLHVTTLNTVTEKSLSSTLRSQVDSMTRLIHIYYPDRVTLTTSLEGIECNITTDVCPLNMICTESRDGQTRCLCDSSSFYNRNVKTCSPLAQLQVKNISASATADKVFLNWTTNTYGSNVTYTVQVTPDNEWITTSSTTACGAVLSGLDPGTEYNFTITSNLTSRFFEKLTETSLAGVWTNAVHGNSCNVSVPKEGITCMGPHIRCIQRFEGLAYCLCSPGYYFNMDKTCRDVNELQVKNLNATSITNDTVTFSWMANKHGSDVVYRIEPQPHTGQEVPNSVGIHGGMWTGLYPGMQYNFSVISVLPADDFYENITVASQVLNIWTKSAHGMTCSTDTDMCAIDLHCIHALNGRKRCLCNDTSFYSPSLKACLPVTELQVLNLSTSSSTNNSVQLTWTASNFGTNVTYTIQPSPYKGQVVAGSVGVNGGVWGGLDSGTQYNFTVTAQLVTEQYTRNISSSVCGIWTKAVHGDSCNVSATTEGNTCMGSHIRCIQRFEGLAFCLCSPGYYFNMDNTCRDVNELQVKNLNATSITNDTVTLSWLANKHGSDVVYRIEPQPHTGQEVPNSVGIHGGMWTGLYPGMQYNFSVTSVLPANNFYENITVASQVLNIWTKVLINVTIDISYVKQDAEFQPFMSNSSSPEYLMEARRITTGVTAVFDKVMDVVYVQLLQFRPVSINQYEVDLVVKLTTYDAETLGQVLSEIIQNNTQNTEGFFYNERLNSLDLSVNNTGIINSNQCPYSVTSLDKGGIKWNAADVGRQYTPCPYNNLLDHPKAMAERICLIGENKLPVWGAVNASLCITKEAAKNPNISEVFKRNITKDNAQTASVYLRMITNSTDNLTAEMMAQSVTVLEKLTTEDVLQEPNVATNVIECVNNLINVNIKTLQQSEKETRVSSRLLDVIDSVANKAPLTEGKLMISTPNLAVAAQKIDSTETRDITLVTEANGNEESNVNIDVLLGDNSQLKNTTSLTVPVPAVIDSLTTEQKQKLNRVSFTVHRSDIIFSVIRSSVNGGRLDEDDDNRDGYNNNNESRKNESFITKINSLVVSASVPEIKIQNLSRNVTMDFEHTNNSATNARCVFWDEKLSHGTGAWSDDGCGVVKSDSESTTCGCNHLTNFALLMDVYNQGSKLSALDRKILSIISYVGCGISCFALLITLITYSAFKKLRRDNPAKILINLCLALLCSNLVYLLGMQEYSFGNTVSCKVVAVLLHYFLLASLTWMAVEAFYMYLALVIVFKTYYTNFILKCSLVGWGAPLLVIIITLAVNTTDNYGFINSGMCWLKNPAFYAAFVGPVCFILLVNCIAFILVVKQLASMSSVRLHKAERNSTIQRLRGAVGVVILLGLTWIFAIFAIGQASVAFYYLFAVFNSLQGLFIFIFYCLLKNDAVVALKRSLPCFEEYGDSTKSYSHSKGATNTAAGHHLIDHKTGSSKKKDSSKGTLSTTADSRKDSCFSTLSGSNIVDDKDADGVNSNTNTISNEKATSRLLHTSHDVSEDTSSNMSTNSDKPMKYSIPEFREREDITIAEPPTGIQDTSFCQHSSEADGGSFYNIPLSPTDASLPKLTPPSLSLSQTSDQNSLQMKSPENSPVCLKHADETPNPSNRADGEIDYSHLASVGDILNKLESNTQHSVTDIDNNVTKPEQPTQETEDDTSSYMITNCDTPTGYFESDMHDPDVRDTSLHASVESQEARLYENLPVTSNDYTSDIPTTHTDDPLPIPSCLHRFQTSNLSSLQMESPENSFSCSLDPTDQTNEEKLNPSFTPFRADGEIDYSHLASVSDIQHKFEWSMSESSDKNVTKI